MIQYSLSLSGHQVLYVKIESVSKVLTLQTVDTKSKFMRLITCERHKRIFFVVHHMELEYTLGQQYTYLWLRYEADLTCIDWMHGGMSELLVFKKMYSCSSYAWRIKIVVSKHKKVCKLWGWCWMTWFWLSEVEWLRMGMEGREERSLGKIKHCWGGSCFLNNN